LLALLIINFGEISSFKCHYAEVYSIKLGRAYICHMGVQNATDKHVDDKKHKDVTIMRISDSNEENLPLDRLSNRFNNLMSLEMVNVTYSNLNIHDSFKKLRIFSVSNSRVSYVGKQIVKNKGQIEKVLLKNNVLNQIDADTFDDFVNLELVDLSNNTCIDEVFNFRVGKEDLREKNER
jgi:hypothetical protein